MSVQSKAYLWLLGITLIWGCNWPLIEGVFEFIPPYTFVVVRYLGAAILITAIFWKKLRLLNADYIKRALIIGIPFSIGATLQMVGFEKTSIANASFITGLSVVVMPIIVLLFDRKKPTKRELFGIVAAFVGVTIMTVSGSLDAVNFGDMIVLIGVVGFAFQFYFVNKFGGGVDTILLTMLIFWINGLLALPVAMATDMANTQFSFEIFWVLAYTIVLATFVALIIQNRELPKVNPTHAVIIFLLEPVTATTLSFIKGDPLSTQQIFGAVLIIVATLLVTMNAQSEETLPEKSKA